MPKIATKPRADKANKTISGELIIGALKKKFATSNDSKLAAHIGGTSNAIGMLKRKRKVTPLQIAGLVERAVNSSGKTIYKRIVEFHHVERHKIAKRFQPLNAGDKKYTKLVKAVRDARGIYFFYDSSERVIYVGKTEKQNLWSEMINAFNRGNIRNQIYLTGHPKKRMGKKSSNQKKRRLVRKNVKLHDSAHYFSAYDVRQEFIKVMEQMIIRAMPNNLVNTRIEGQTAH